MSMPFVIVSCFRLFFFNVHSHIIPPRFSHLIKGMFRYSDVTFNRIALPQFGVLTHSEIIG